MNSIPKFIAVGLAFGGVLALGLVEAQAGKQARRFKETKDLVVTLVTPTNNQEVLPDLSDPGLNNVVTIRFSASLRPRDVINPNNVFNRLSNKVEVMDSTFSRLPGTPRVRRNVFTFDPRTTTNGGVLAQGQYTVNLKRNLRNRRGRLLNQGVRDFSTTFSVGTDVYSPVLRKISPIQGQRNIGLTQKVIATFNEPIDPNSAISTVLVQDASVNPPAVVPGAGGGTGVTVERDGFDLVFTPDPCFGYPPNTSVQFLIQGLDHPVPPATPSATPLTDVFGNPFDRDPGLQWAFNGATGLHESPNGSYHEPTGIFRMSFTTKGIKPPPVGLIPGSPQYNGNPPPIPGPPPAYCAPCQVLVWFAPSCMCGGNVFFYTTGNGLGEISMVGFINRFNQGITDFSLLSVVPNSPVRMGRPGGMVIDPRFDPVTFHTYMYLIDQRSAAVRVLDSRNMQTLGRIAGFRSPRDVTIGTDVGLNRTMLYVSDFSSNQLVGVDLQSIAISFTGQPGAPSPCEAIKDNQNFRTFLNTGKGPTGVAADGYLLGRVMVTNTLDNSVSVFNTRDNVHIGDYAAGANPVDCDWCTIQFGAVRVAMIANQGGLNEEDGSVSLYINTAGGTSGGVGRERIESSITDGIKNPTNVWGNSQWILPPPSLTSTPLVWYVPNSGGNSIIELRISSTGLFGRSITPNSPSGPRFVGRNPTWAGLDPFYPVAFLFAAVAGTGQFAGMDPARGISPEYVNVPGLRRIYTCYTH